MQMNNPVHVINLAVTVRAAVDLKAGTFVRYPGNYSTTAALLGVVLADAKAGELASVGVKGLFQVARAASTTFAVGDEVSINATGQAATGGTAVARAFEVTPNLITVIL